MTMDAKIFGSGAVRVIALHGWFGDRDSFDSLFAGMDPDRFSIAVPDLRGYGTALDEPGPFDLATIASDVIALADRLGWERFSLMGHSMGGKAMLKAAIVAPARVGRLVGIAPVWAGPAPFDADTLAFFRSAASNRSVRQAIVDLSTDGRLPAHWTARIAADSWSGSRPEAFAGYLESWALEDFADDAALLAIPALVVAGAHDRGVPEEWVRSTWASRVRDCTVEVLADAGHYPADETPLRLARIVGDFLEDAAPR